MWDWVFASLATRETERDAEALYCPPKQIRILAVICDLVIGAWQNRQQAAQPKYPLNCPSVNSNINGLLSPSHTACKFEFRPPLGRSIRRELLHFEQAVLWALRCVGSIITMSVVVLVVGSSAKMWSKTSAQLERMKGLQRVLCGPCRYGALRHIKPFRMT
jgi:hypothetical protein